MKLKIPPVFQVALFASLMWILTKFTNIKHFQFEHQKMVSWFVFIIGILIGIIAVYAFKIAQTTVDPTNPDKASKLVIIGIYKYTRNPIYLGMFFILLAFAIRLGNYYTFPVLIIYVWYITTYQIKPEEEALKKLFGEEFINYTKFVRRWI